MRVSRVEFQNYRKHWIGRCTSTSNRFQLNVFRQRAISFHKCVLRHIKLPPWVCTCYVTAAYYFNNITKKEISPKFGFSPNCVIHHLPCKIGMEINTVKYKTPNRFNCERWEKVTNISMYGSMFDNRIWHKKVFIEFDCLSSHKFGKLIKTVQLPHSLVNFSHFSSFYDLNLPLFVQLFVQIEQEIENNCNHEIRIRCNVTIPIPGRFLLW